MIRRFVLALLPIVLVSDTAMGETCTVADPTDTPLNVRRTPNGPVVGALLNGIPVSIRERRGDWANIVPRTGQSGWVFQKYLDCSGSSAARPAEPLIVPTRVEIDGNAILYACTSNEPKTTEFCHTYMTAVGDTLAFVRGLIKEQFPICMEGKITSRQMGEVVVKYIRENPRDRHLNAATISALAFKDAWPCGN
jgi:Rap1a immunity proteins/Bacterial SH3 domain